MGPRSILLMAVLGAACLAGCAAFPPPKEAIPASRAFAKGYDDVWEAVLASLSDQNIRAKSIDKKTGTIVAEDVTLDLRQFEPGRYDSTYCFCGSPGRHHIFRELIGEYAISVARETGDRSSMRIEASYRASNYFGERFVGWISCPSNGVFELFFPNQVQSRLDAVIPPAPPSRKLDWWKPSRED